MQALTRIARSANIARCPTSASVILRPLFNPAVHPKLQHFARCFATGKGKKAPAAKANPPSITAQLIKKLDEEIVYEQENYESPPSVEEGPPKGWEKVEIGDIIGDNEGFVVLERTFKNEKVCVLTSTQVLDDEVVDEDEDEDEDARDQLDEDDEDAEMASATMLVAISKKSQSQPLFIECSIDRYGCQIVRAHIGAGLSGLNDEMRGPSGILYHAYMAYRQDDEASPAPAGEDSSMTSSPYFDTLDDELQGKWEEFVEERGIKEDLAVYLLDMLEEKEQASYVRFLTTAKDWFSDTPAEVPP